MIGPQARVLPDGRLHLQHGPIDLIVGAFGDRDETAAAYVQATERFADILETLVGELPILRRPVGEAHPLLRGPVARRMADAVWPHRAVYITPMAAVAGAVADEMLAALRAIGGSLTVTVWGAEQEDADSSRIVRQAAAIAGRVLFAGVPTGVAVTRAQHHGGPWPASTQPHTTSVGLMAMQRFLRPVALQDPPEWMTARAGVPL